MNYTELQLGREIALEVTHKVRELGCKPCGIGAAIAHIEERHGIRPVFDWRGARARAAGHACPLTTWDKPAPFAPDPRLPPERDDDEEGVPF